MKLQLISVTQDSSTDGTKTPSGNGEEVNFPGGQPENLRDKFMFKAFKIISVYRSRVFRTESIFEWLL
jgi:hypothetical protein